MRDSIGCMLDCIAAGAGKPKHHVGKDVVTDKRGRKWFVSTVRLPFMHNGGIYETMVFPTDSDDPNAEPSSWGEFSCNRYMTEALAVAGHDDVCQRMREFDGEVGE